MTHKEKIIATAYTGIMFVDGSELGEVYAYEEEKLGHGVIDIMHADEEFQQKVRDAVHEDFLAMISKDDKLIDKACETFKAICKEQGAGSCDREWLCDGCKKYEHFRKAMKGGTNESD